MTAPLRKAILVDGDWGAADALALLGKGTGVVAVRARGGRWFHLDADDLRELIRTSRHATIEGVLAAARWHPSDVFDVDVGALPDGFSGLVVRGERLLGLAQHAVRARPPSFSYDELNTEWESFTAAPPPPAAAPAPPAAAPTPPAAGPPHARPPPAAAPAPAPRPPPTAAAPAAPRVYPLVEAPDAVVLAEEFPLRVGLSSEAVAGVAGAILLSSPSAVVRASVDAPGFTLRDGESWRQDLVVSAGAPLPTAVLHLVPIEVDPPLRSIRVVYAVDGQPVGIGIRVVQVLAGAAAAAHVDQPRAPPLGVTPVEKADLQVVILRKPGTAGVLRWVFGARDPAVQAALPADPIERDIGGRGEEFALRIVRRIRAREGKADLYEHLVGTGRDVADAAPRELARAVARAAEVAGAAGRRPTILLLAEEPYVPWELAVLDAPLDAGAPPFLGAQAEVGRWVFSDVAHPPLPPPTRTPRLPMTVFYADEPPTARVEADALKLAFDAQTCVARLEDILAWARAPHPGVLHFALHGKYAPGDADEGLVLAGGDVLQPATVRGIDLPTRPFVVMNACQVGAGADLLGCYAGMAAEFLKQGAAGVVAPLWSVRDDVAAQIARDLYGALRGGASAGASLRAIRARFTSGSTTSTPLAYQLFAHPQLVLAP